MSRKVKSAGALSLAATLGVILFGAEGTRAYAEETFVAPMAAAAAADGGEIAVETPDQAETTQPAVTFVSQPVVQDAPADPEPEMRDARSLAELVAAEPVPADLDEQMRCLAGAIYFESKGEPLSGQLAVGRVIIARAESSRFPSSYCGVVYQRSQFSFVRGGRMPAINTASRAWQRAKKLAVIAHEGAWDSPAEGALFFHARYVSPRWKNRLTRLAQIDNHIFYR